ncbi:LCP family protein [Paenibacillus sp. JCM 10914]|uniref:LCP family protein n=1 Tax=Paenibacillus sp. JCM 10914 TaxID=1236974 RepID=UPI0003CC555C|nr:LCP family protein [Paenibacillus sp. JCM 10914]GAE05641.1 cell division protein FtsI [Paenibacillus sp. JCM 10914]
MEQTPRPDLDSLSSLRRPRKQKHSEPTSKLKWLGISLALVLLVGGLGYVFRKELAWMAFQMFFAKDVKHTLDQSYKPVGNPDAADPVAKATRPFSLLLLGVDQRKNEITRSDTMIYSVIRPDLNKILLVSIPRDTYTEIIGRDVTSRINSAYAHGGAKMAIDTVEHLFQHAVDYYATINFYGLIDIVDALDGVKLPINKVIENKQSHHIPLRIEPNKPIYDGTDALNYVRYREDSDFNRTARQRIFLSSLMDRVFELKNITKIPELIQIGGSNLTMDLNSDFILNLVETLMFNDSPPSFENYMLKGSDLIIRGDYYYEPHQSDINYIQTLIGNWLDEETTLQELMIPTAH